MICLKEFFMKHPWTGEREWHQGPGREGYIKFLDIRLSLIKLQFSLKCRVKALEGLLLRVGCLFFPSWHFIDHDSICTTGNILKLNDIYTYRENGNVHIVRLIDVYCVNEYLYCSLYFFDRNQIITVSQKMKPRDYFIWRIMDNREYDEFMSRRMWQKVTKQDDLLDFGF